MMQSLASLHRRLSTHLLSLILLFSLVLLINCSGELPTELPEVPPPSDDFESAVWPLVGRAVEDGDLVVSPFGPRMRLSGEYNFHAGMDILAPIGTPVHAILDGIVTQVRPWDGRSTLGNFITIRHENGSGASYLHLERMLVEEGQRVNRGAVVATVGNTGAQIPHLQIEYFPELRGARDASRARNPLEVLLFQASAQRIEATFTATGVELLIPLQPMTIGVIELHGGGSAHRLDYYEIVRSARRSDPIRNGIRIEASWPFDMKFQLRLTLQDRRPDRVVITSIKGQLLLDASR